MVLNSENPPHEASFFFEIGAELARTKVHDFGRTESNEKTTRPWTQESREFDQLSHFTQGINNHS
jgi:hypothetical protein